MRSEDCAICEERPGTKLMPDGRAFCGPCAIRHPEKGQPKPDRRSLVEAYGDFVALVKGRPIR